MIAFPPSARISRRLALVVAAGAIAGAAAGAFLGLREGPPPAPGAEAPEGVAALAFADASGRMRSLTEFRGKAILLNLWATWCGPCREEMPTLDRLQAKLGGPDFEVVTVSLDRSGPERVEEFLAEIGATHLPIYIADTVAVRRAVGIFGLPATLFVDREGREVHRIVGPAEWDSPEMIALIRERLDLPAEAAGSGKP
jgi:thiol-disulfide isomerase/thioredoxin